MNISVEIIQSKARIRGVRNGPGIQKYQNAMKSIGKNMIDC